MCSCSRRLLEACRQAGRVAGSRDGGLNGERVGDLHWRAQFLGFVMGKMDLNHALGSYWCILYYGLDPVKLQHMCHSLGCDVAAA